MSLEQSTKIIIHAETPDAKRIIEVPNAPLKKRSAHVNIMRRTRSARRLKFLEKPSASMAKNQELLSKIHNALSPKQDGTEFSIEDIEAVLLAYHQVKDE